MGNKILLDFARRFFLVLTLSFGLFGAGQVLGQATVETDKRDYFPGEYVVITGSGWQPGETVVISFEETPKPTTCMLSHDRTAVADANGDIYEDQFLIKENHRGVLFIMTATGQSSGLIAENWFTDATITSNQNGDWGSASTWSAIARTGTISYTNGSPIVTGNGTSFLTELAPGSIIITGNPGGITRTVASIQSNTSLTLTSNANSNQSGKSFTAQVVPFPGDAVVITNGHDVIVNGTFTSASLIVGVGNGIATLTFSGTSPQLTVNGDIILGNSVNSNRRGFLTFTDGSKLIANGSVTVGNNGANGSINMTAGGELKINSFATSTGTWTPGTGTVELASTNTLPTTIFTTFNNLTISGGTTTFGPARTINGNLTVNSGAIADLGSVTHTAGSLTLGGLGTDDGTWGSTSSTATFQNNTFFAATVGRITVNTDTRSTPTVTPTIGSYIYNGNQNGPTAATNTGTGTSYTFSYAGVSPTTYGPSSTRPINAGSYTVTATVAASTDGFYKGASSVATPFSIAKAGSTISVDAAGPFTYNTNPQGPDQVTKSGSTGAVTFSYVGVLGTTYAASSTKPTNAGSYEVTATLAGDDNYNGAVSDPLEFTITVKEASVTPDANTKEYGSADPALTGTLEGFLPADNVTAVYSREAGETVLGGPYEISAVLSPAGVLSNYDITYNTAEFTITPAPTTITVQDALADCDGDDVVLTANVSSSAQFEVNGTGGTVTFKNGTTTIGTVSSGSVTGGEFSGSFPISLPLGSTYNISAEFVPNSGNLTGSQTTSLAQLTVLQAFISTSVPKNANGNVVIFDGAATSLGLPSSTILTATYQPSTYPGVTYKWYQRNVGGNFSIIGGATGSTYQVFANGDFVREYMVELIVNGNCVGNAIFTKVISVEASCGKEGQNKVQVCHVTPNGKRNTICVSANAVEALLKGSPGSYVGSCTISYRAEQDPELITVAWNTPVELIKGEIVKQSEKWFNRKKINMNISTDSYNALQPGMYTLTAELEANDFYELDEPIAINVLVLDKPQALDITISNDKVAKDARSGQVIGTLSTIDPVDAIHTYEIAENANLTLDGDKVIWTGTSVPAQLTLTVFSTDRAGQTISREIKLRKELKPGEFFMYPNPATTETNIMLDLDESATVAFQVYDAIGRLVIQDEVYKEGSFTHTIKVDGLAPGMYTVQLKVGNMVMTKRLIKK